MFRIRIFTSGLFRTFQLEEGYILKMRSLRKIYHPEIFQGSLRNKNYFEGWYFKHVSADKKNAFAIVAGLSLSGDSHSFVQYIEGNLGKSTYFRYSVDEFSYKPERFEISIGNSSFTSGNIKLALRNSEFEITGELENSGITPFPSTFLMPGIMGWYSFIPWMECNHGIVSFRHMIDGRINVNGTVNDYTNGSGYIEKDWGTSFPESWLWLQCNSFGQRDISVMISVAKIPWRGSWFIGLISFLNSGDRTVILATYNHARVLLLRRIDDMGTEIVIRKGMITLSALVTKKGAGTLKAPMNGRMDTYIKESLDSEVFVELKEGVKVLFSGKGSRAGFEETESIFNYFRSSEG